MACWEGKVSSRLCGAVYSLLAGPRGKLTITCESAVFFRNNNQNWQRFNRVPSCCLDGRRMVQQPAQTDRHNAGQLQRA